MIDFPTSPAIDQIVTAPNGTKWKWDGTTWVLTTTPGTGGASGVTLDFVNSFTEFRRDTNVAMSTTDLGTYDVVWETKTDPDAWTDPGSTSNLKCPETGLYMIGARCAGSFGTGGGGAGSSWALQVVSGSVDDYQAAFASAVPDPTSSNKRGGLLYVTVNTIIRLRISLDGTGGPVSGTLDWADIRLARLR